MSTITVPLVVTVVFFLRVEAFVDTFFKVAAHGVKNVDFLILSLQVLFIFTHHLTALCSLDYSPPPVPKRSVSPHSPAPANRVYRPPPLRPPHVLDGMPLCKFIAFSTPHDPSCLSM